MTEAVPTLSCMTEFIVDCLHKTAPTQEIGFPLIRTPNIGRGRFNLDGVYRISKETYEKWTIRAVPQKNDLIMAREAPAGNIAIIKSDEPHCLGQRTVHIRPNPELIDPDFLTYFLLAPKQQAALLKNQIGVHVGHVNMKDIRKLPLEDLPPMEEQTKRAQIIAKYDDLIGNNKRRIELLEESAQQLYKEWFVRFLFPGHEHVAIIDGVPEGWATNNLGSFVNISKGKNITKNTVVHGEIPVVAGGLNPAYYHNKSNTKGPVITVSASGANAGYVNLYQENVWASDCSYIESEGDVSIPFYYLMLKERQLEITSMQKGAAQPHVYPKDLMRLVVKMPPRSMLEQFTDLAAVSFNQIRVLRLQNKQLVSARDLLLPKLMNGEVAV